jgi:hypothetical protein
MSTRVGRFFTVLLAIVLLGNGCVTRSLWEERGYHPAANSKLRLSYSPLKSNILVQYRESRGTSESSRARAYWLFDSHGVPKEGKPHFVNPKNRKQLIPIPLVTEHQGSNTVSTSSYLAIADSEQQDFYLWREETLLGHFELPAYSREASTAVKVVVTPAAVTADVLCAAAMVLGFLELMMIISYFDSEAAGDFVIEVLAR